MCSRIFLTHHHAVLSIPPFKPPRSRFKPTYPVLRISVQDTSKNASIGFLRGRFIFFRVCSDFSQSLSLKDSIHRRTRHMKLSRHLRLRNLLPCLLVVQEFEKRLIQLLLLSALIGSTLFCLGDSLGLSLSYRQAFLLGDRRVHLNQDV